MKGLGIPFSKYCDTVWLLVLYEVIRKNYNKNSLYLCWQCKLISVGGSPSTGCFFYLPPLKRNQVNWIPLPKKEEKEGKKLDRRHTLSFWRILSQVGGAVNNLLGTYQIRIQCSTNGALKSSYKNMNIFVYIPGRIPPTIFVSSAK